MPAPPRPPPQLLQSLIRALLSALETQTQSPFNRLARPLMSLITRRIVAISHRFRRYAERIVAGKAFPRRRGTIRKPATPRKYVPDPLPRKAGWLETILPGMPAHRGNLFAALQSPEMVALIEAAPDQMGRVLRPLCRMLGLQPPKNIASPPRKKPVRKPRPKPPPDPRRPHDPRPRDRFGFYKGPPLFPGIAAATGPPRKKPA
jgi:hypothetical protein